MFVSENGVAVMHVATVEHLGAGGRRNRPRCCKAPFSTVITAHTRRRRNADFHVIARLQLQGIHHAAGTTSPSRCPTSRPADLHHPRQRYTGSRAALHYAPVGTESLDSGPLVLLIDSVGESRELYGHWLITHGFAPLSTPRGHVALWLLERHRVEFILLQRELRDMSALEFLHRLRSSRSSTAALPVIVLSDAEDVMIDRALRKAGASAVVQSLGNFDRLERAVDGLKRQPRPLVS